MLHSVEGKKKDTEESFPTFSAWWRSFTTPPPQKRRKAAEAARKSPAAFNLKGELKPGQGSPFSVGGTDIIIDSDSWVFGELTYGATATVTGVRRSGGERYATKIVVGKG